MGAIQLKNVTKKFGDQMVIDDLNLSIEDGSFTVLVGPSGCGKSTTLRMITGLDEPTSGDIYIDGKKINDLTPGKRDIAMVFQNYALYPTMTVRENIEFGLENKKVPKEERKKRVQEICEVVGLTQYLDRKPATLSGGQRQRVALARAMVKQPKVFLMDEPLSNLDAKLRGQMRVELIGLHKKLGTTFVYVTHDQVEAMSMADDIVLMKDGYIVQQSSPRELYNNPNCVYAAQFIGTPQMNFINAKLLMLNGKYTVEFGSEDTKTTRGVKYQVTVPESKVDPEVLEPLVDQEVVLGVRPECIHDEPAFLAQATTGVINTTVEVTEMMGAETYLYLNCEGIQLTARVSPRSDVRPQDELKVAIDPNRIHIFDKETEKAVLN